MTSPLVRARSRRSYWQLATWVAALLALVLLGGVALREIEQQRQLARGEAVLVRLASARMDLSRGFLQMALAGESRSPFDRSQGEALARQALDTIDSVGDDPNFAPLVTPAFRESIDAFRQTLAGPGEGAPETTARRQQAWRLVESEALQFSDAAETSLKAVDKRRDAEIAVTTALTAILLTASATGIVLTARGRRSQRAAERRWILAIDGAGHGVWDYDFGLDSMYYSVSLRAMLGFAERDERWDPSAKWLTRVHPDDREAVVAAMEAHVSAAAPRFRAEYRMQCRDGGWLWVLAQGMAVERDGTGRASRVVGTLTDISEIRRMTAELEAHHRLLEQRVAERTAELQQANEVLASRAELISDLYNNVPCGYHSLDANGVVVAINDTELQWLGYERDEVVGRMRAQDLMTPESIARFEANFREFLRIGSVRDLEFDLVRRDGSSMAVILSATAIFDAQGRFVQSRTTVFDNRERRQRAREIDTLNAELERRAAEAEAATRSKSAFLANMSHEIRTPMNAIIGLTHLLRRDARDTTQVDRLDKVAAAADHLLAVINDILDLSKIEAGHFVLAQGLFDLESVVGTVAQMIADRAEAKGIEVVVEFDPTLLRDFTGDAVRLSQALLNYAGNAVKFTDFGAIALRARCVEESDAAVTVRFEVEDTGIGIEARHQERLFRAFEQADNTTTRKHGGTGLGLAINMRLARLMGGEVGVDSAQGKGSTFWMTARFGKRPDSPGETRAIDLRRRRALVIDAEPRARAAMGSLLSAFGANVAVTAALDEATALLEQGAAAGEPFDILLIDKQVARLDPSRVGRWRPLLSADASARALLTNWGSGESARATAAACGLDGVIDKPMLPSRLVAVLLRGRADGAPVLSAGLAIETEARVRKALLGIRVLLVEDNPINQDVALDLLDAAGLVVDVAADGAEAVSKASEFAYDIILMDMQLPVMDGLEATRAIRQVPTGRSVPIIAMTANAFSEDREACLAAGMNDHLGKPVDPARLHEMLLKWVPGRQEAVPLLAEPVADPQEEAFAPLPGIDAEAGIRLARGRAEVFRQRLQRFADSASVDVGAFDTALGEGRVEDARRWAHSLKGVAGFIGAGRVQALASSLESTFDPKGADADRRSARDAVAAELDALLTAIRGLETPTGPSDAEIRAVVDSLADLLAQDNVKANQQLRESRAVLKHVLGDRLGAFEYQVSRFDYAEALAMLRASREAVRG